MRLVVVLADKHRNRGAILETITSLAVLLMLGRLAEFGCGLAFVVGSRKWVKTFGR